jgi:hypothetical protein
MACRPSPYPRGTNQLQYLCSHSSRLARWARHSIRLCHPSRVSKARSIRRPSCSSMRCASVERHALAGFMIGAHQAIDGVGVGARLRRSISLLNMTTSRTQALRRSAKLRSAIIGCGGGAPRVPSHKATSSGMLNARGFSATGDVPLLITSNRVGWVSKAVAKWSRAVHGGWQRLNSHHGLQPTPAWPAHDIGQYAGAGRAASDCILPERYVSAPGHHRCVGLWR